jgi:hypothetical protein
MKIVIFFTLLFMISDADDQSSKSGKKEIYDEEYTKHLTNRKIVDVIPSNMDYIDPKLIFKES